MPYELNEIKDIRKKAGLTQGQLASKAGVSQSLIAKIEAGLLDPTFSNAQKIFKALDDLTQRHEVKAEELMNTSVISLEQTDTVKDAIKRMKKHEISQMPVVDGDKILGIVTESTIINKMGSVENPEKLMNLKVSEVMIESPPIITKNTQMDVVSSLLKFYPVLLVSDSGKIKGVITKADMLRKIYKS